MTLRRGKKLIVIAHNIRSLHNIGSLFRTADAVGVEKIFLTGFSGIPDHPKVAKVALGAEKTILWKKYSRIGNLLKQLKKDGYQIVALEQDPMSVAYDSFCPRFPIALIVGNEVSGISRAILKNADAIIEIPQKGRKESLNVSVAFGIAVYALCGGLRM
ncbi:MAG: TrmH family RNA methyltransferase [Patescibacteria group bacterium]